MDFPIDGFINFPTCDCCGQPIDPDDGGSGEFLHCTHCGCRTKIKRKLKMADMEIKVVVDTSELNAMCRVTCTNRNCVHHGNDIDSCDKKNIFLDENGCIYAKDGEQK